MTYVFDRYIGAMQMAQGVKVEAKDEVEAERKAREMFIRDAAPGEMAMTRFVLSTR